MHIYYNLWFLQNCVNLRVTLFNVINVEIYVLRIKHIIVQFKNVFYHTTFDYADKLNIRLHYHVIRFWVLHDRTCR